MIEVSELYIAPQGEGPHAGRSSLFVRLRRCVLTCIWCDSKNTWSKDDPEYNAFTTYETPGLLVAAMLNEARLAPFPPEAVVFTGGEPLIWQRDLPWIIESYSEGIIHEFGTVPAFEVETAGTIMPSDDMLDIAHFNVSHKMSSAGNEHMTLPRLWPPEVIKAYLAHNAVFKPVVAPDDELSLRMYLSLLSKYAHEIYMPWNWVRSRVYLMPCAANVQELHERQPRVFQLALELGVRATTRAHIVAYGSERRR